MALPGLNFSPLAIVYMWNNSLPDLSIEPQRPLTLKDKTTGSNIKPGVAP